MLNIKKYRIRPLRFSDLTVVLRWRNQSHIRKFMFTSHRIGQSEHEHWYRRIVRSLPGHHLIVSCGSEPLGFVQFTPKDTSHGYSQWGFYIGNPKAPKGSGLALGYLGLQWAFSHLGVRKVCSEVFTFNIASLNFHRKLGFRHEGILKNHRLKNGRYEDIVLFGMLRSDWPNIRRKLRHGIMK